MQNILLFEPDPSGHRMVFVRYIVEAIARQGSMRTTLVTSPHGAAAPWVQAMPSALGQSLTLHVAPAPTPHGLPALHPKLGRQWAASEMLRSAATALRAQAGVDYVFIPFLDDYCLFPFAWNRRPFGATPWGGIAVRPRFHLGPMGAHVPPRFEDHVERIAYRGLLRSPTLQALFSIDPYFAPFLGDPRISTVCDPADIAAVAADPDWLPVPDTAVVLLVYGNIDHRKGIEQLLSVAADPSVPDDLVIALVGAQEPSMAPVLDSIVARRLRTLGRLIEVPRRVSDEEEASAFARADIVWGYYPASYSSSGAMVRAGQMGRPFLTTREGLAGRITAEQQSGMVASESDPAALLPRLLELVRAPELRRKMGDAGRRHFGGDTGSAFGDRIAQHLARLPGAPSA